MRFFFKRLWQDICQALTNPSKEQFAGFGDFFHKLSVCLVIGVFFVHSNWIDITVLAISALAFFIYGTMLIGQGE